MHGRNCPIKLNEIGAKSSYVNKQFSEDVKKISRDPFSHNFEADQARWVSIYRSMVP